MLRITSEEAKKLREQGFKYANESINGVIHKTDALILIREKL